MQKAKPDNKHRVKSQYQSNLKLKDIKWILDNQKRTQNILLEQMVIGRRKPSETIVSKDEVKPPQASSVFENIFSYVKRAKNTNNLKNSQYKNNTQRQSQEERCSVYVENSLGFIRSLIKTKDKKSDESRYENLHKLKPFIPQSQRK